MDLVGVEMRAGKDASSGRDRASDNKRGKKRNRFRFNVRSSVSVKSGRSSVAVVVLIIMILAATAVLVWLGLDIAGGMLFANNDNFIIRNLVIKNGGPTIKDYITGKRGISEGVNMFSFDITELRDEFLAQAPNYRSMEISRRLPDTLIVEVFERVPVARVGIKGGLVTDREGWTFVSRSAPETLPSLRKYSLPTRPGVQLTGMAVAALELLEACDDPRMGIDVDVIEVDKAEYLHLDLSDGKGVKICWAGMGERTKKSEVALKDKLKNLAKVLRSESGAEKKFIDLTYDEKVYAE